MGPFTTPKKRAEATSADPWTPTSNLKMLISAASPEIRNREKEMCMETDERDGLEPTQVGKVVTCLPINVFETPFYGYMFPAGI